MNKTKKILSLNQVLFYSDNLIEKLEKLALEGWRLKKFNANTITLEECESQKLKYCILFSPNSTTLDATPTQPQEDLIDLCKSSGWEYLSQWSQILVFFSELENATPIETDEQLKLETIHNSMKKEFLRGQITIILSQLFLLVCMLIALKPEQIFTSVPIYTITLIPMVIFQSIANLFQYYNWYYSSKKAIENGENCTKPISIKWVNYFMTILAVIICVLLLMSNFKSMLFYGFGIPIMNAILCYGVIIYLRKQKLKAQLKYEIHLWITVAICVIVQLIVIKSTLTDDMPKFANYNGYECNYYESQSIFASYNSYNLINLDEKSYADLEVYSSNFDFVNDLILSSVLKLTPSQTKDNISWESIYQDDNIIAYTYSIDGLITNREYAISTQDKILYTYFILGFTDEMKIETITKLLDIE